LIRIIKGPFASLAFVALGVLLLNGGPVTVQTADDFFGGQVLQRIDLFINSDDWRTLQADTGTRAYHPATLKWGDIVARNVGVRSERRGGRDERKPRLRVDASWYVSGGTFLSLPSLTLDNLSEDASAVRRTVTLRFYQWMDLPAPRAVHAALYVNNAFAGVYTVIEPVDHAVARYVRGNGQDRGRLYRYTSPVPYRLNYLGTDLSRYQDLFQVEPEQPAFASDDYAAIEEMIRTLNSNVGAPDERRLAKYVDMRQFMKIAAVQNFLGVSGGIAGPDGMSDFSLEVRRRTDAVQFMPNGELSGLMDPRHPIEQGLAGNVVARQARQVEALFQSYVDTLRASADIADKRDRNRPAGSGPALQAEVDREQRLIDEAIRADSLKVWTDREFTDASATVIRFARERAAFVRCQVAALLHQTTGCGAEPALAGESSRRSVSPRAASYLQPSTAATAPATNIALGRPYTMTPRPSYALTSDPGDDTQLTDGAYTAGTFWTHTTTVGWTNAVPVVITIDLGQIEPISGASYSTAAGAAGVFWPRSIFVLVSDDGQRFFPAGDLAAQAADRPATGYATSRFVRTDFRTHGRYVAFIVDPTGPYTFCDEIEVLSGDPGWLRTPVSGESTSDLQRFFVDARTRVSMARRLAADAGTVRRELESSAQISAAVRARLVPELAAAENEVDAIPAPAHDSFRAVLPLNATHTRIFAVHGQAAQARGLPPLSAWVVNPWDFVRPFDEPPAGADGPGTLSIAAMSGETRSGAINFSNATGRSMKVALDVDAGTAGSDLRLYEAIWTDTRELTPVADALVPLREGPSFDVPAGMTRQLWINFTPADREPGTSRGRLRATSEGGISVGIPLELRVLSGSFPARPTLHLGGWDYTDGDQIYALTPNNRDALIRQLRLLNVDSPWARRAMLPGTYDGAGHLKTAPDTSIFDRWVSSWPDANRYMIFVNASDSLGDVPVTDARFPTAAADWIKFWATHAARLGVQPSQLVLLLVDEPHLPSQDERIVTWARAIKAGEPRVRIWEDPTYTDPAASLPQLLGVADLLALKRSLMLEQGARFVDFYRQRRARGQGLDVYGASGPARLLDPYTYYRLQGWVCADIGAGGSFFWSFVDDGDRSSWNEYAAKKTLYSPFFLSSDDVTISKHTEAIREGVEDFEYLAMLRDRVTLLSRTDPNRAGLSRAIALLDSAAGTVLGAPGASDMEWVSDKERLSAERVRLAIADLLEMLR
jgi:hypothetical protein